MPLPVFDADGTLPAGIHAASLRDVRERYATNDVRRRQMDLLELVVAAALQYETIKRVLVWGSFVTAKPEPGDLDYSIVVGAGHRDAAIVQEHRRFFVEHEARLRYGIDVKFLVIEDYPLSRYVELMDFLTHDRWLEDFGIVEISLRGEQWSTIQ